MILVLRNSWKLRTLCRSAGKELQCDAADGFRGVKINRNADIAWERFIHIVGKVNAVSCVIDKIMAIDPRFASADSHAQSAACGCQFEAVTVVVLNAVADDTAEIVTEILGCVGSVKVL